MSRMVLKERVFSPTGKSLGTFSAVDLIPFDLRYTESDAPQKKEAGGQAAPRDVPPPKDSNPLRPEGQDQNNSQSGPPDYSGGNKDQQGQQKIPDKWDVGDYDIDQDEGPTQDQINNAPKGGGAPASSSPDSGAGKQQSQGDGSGQSEDSDGDLDGQGGLDGDSSEEDLSDEGDGSSGNSQGDIGDRNSSMGNKDQHGQSPDSQNQGSKNRPSGDNSSSVGNDSSSSDDSGYGNGWDDVDGEDGDNLDEFEDSDLSKALDKIDKGQAESTKERNSTDDKVQKLNDARRGNDSNKPSPDEVVSAKDALNDAIKATRESQKKKASQDSSDSDVDSVSDLDNEMLDSMGAGKLTSLVSPKMKFDWRSKLDKIFDMALGLETVINPNLINKKIEDAPPGSEDDDPKISKIVVLMDYSSSMGAEKFKQAIEHVDTMLKARKLGSVQFHIYKWGWGGSLKSSIVEVLNSHKRVKGAQFRKVVMSQFKRGDIGNTCITPAFCALSQKMKKPDAVLIFTDAQIFDVEDFKRTKEAVAYMKKHKKRVIWVLTDDGDRSTVRDLDPWGYVNKMWVRFKKN